MLTPEQKAFRRRGITATDISAILGIDPYRTGWAVQQEKRGLDTFKGNLFSEAGDAMEPIVAREYCRDNAGVILHQGATMQHPEHPLLLATPDYLVEHGAERKVLEIKSVFSYSTSLEWGTPETDEVPKKHLVQVLWQLGVCRLSDADVARFYAGQVRYWRVAFDASMFADMRELALAWWDKHIVRGIDCEPGAADLERVKEGARPVADERAEPAEATPAEAQLLQRWRTAHFEVKAAEERADEAQARVLAAIGVRPGLRHEKILVRYSEARGARTTNWLAIARKRGATVEDVMENTVRGAPYRRPWASFWSEKEKDK